MKRLWVAALLAVALLAGTQATTRANGGAGFGIGIGLGLNLNFTTGANCNKGGGGGGGGGGQNCGWGGYGMGCCLPPAGWSGCYPHPMMCGGQSAMGSWNPYAYGQGYNPGYAWSGMNQGFAAPVFQTAPPPVAPKKTPASAPIVNTSADGK